MDSRLVVLHLSLIDHVGPALVQKIVQALGYHDLHEIYQWTHANFMQRVQLTPAQTHIVVQGLANRESLDQECELIEKHKISWLTAYDEAYPQMLKEIHLPPSIIYYQSIRSFENRPALAFVGSRQANQYAKSVIEALIPALVAHQWMIVSGGAWGADSFAHAATLDVQGITVAVLGSGLVYPYPAGNKKLFQRIIEQGGFLMSCFPLLTQARAEHFPARNRIIAGLSRGVVVVQAAERSGAKITAQYALDQSREVFAIPGSIHDPLSVGCHQLIQQGAKLVWCVEDILSEFGISHQDSTLKDDHEDNKYKDMSLHGQLLRYCAQPTSIDSLVASVNQELFYVQAALFELQLDGKLIQNSAGLWIRS